MGNSRSILNRKRDDNHLETRNRVREEERKRGNLVWECIRSDGGD